MIAVAKARKVQADMFFRDATQFHGRMVFLRGLHFGATLRNVFRFGQMGLCVTVVSEMPLVITWPQCILNLLTAKYIRQVKCQSNARSTTNGLQLIVSYMQSTLQFDQRQFFPVNCFVFWCWQVHMRWNEEVNRWRADPAFEAKWLTSLKTEEVTQ